MHRVAASLTRLRRETRNFGVLLQAARLFVPYSVIELARVTRVGNAKVIAWERGDIVPTAAELAALAVAFRSHPAQMVAAASLFRISYAQAEVEHAAAELPRPMPPRDRLEHSRNQPPKSLPPVRHPGSGRFISGLRVARGLIRSETTS